MIPALTLAVFVAATAAMVDRPNFDANTLLKRQEGTSGAQYQCHSDCGHTILDASADNCDNSTWTELLSNCQECANTYNILRYYGDQVESAADDCGLTVTFSPSEGASSASAPSETSQASASSSIVDAATTPAPSSIDAVATAPNSTTASGGIVPSSASNNSTGTTPSATPSAIEESTGAGMRYGVPLGTAIMAALVFAGAF